MEYGLHRVFFDHFHFCFAWYTRLITVGQKGMDHLVGLLLAGEWHWKSDSWHSEILFIYGLLGSL